MLKKERSHSLVQIYYPKQKGEKLKVALQLTTNQMGSEEAMALAAITFVISLAGGMTVDNAKELKTTHIKERAKMLKAD